MWYHPDRNDGYFQASKNILGFFLTKIQPDGLMVIEYSSEQDALKNGWKCNG